MSKRYQVFVSSTYADLKEERQGVIQTLMEMDCIPAGMELFPAADEDQLDFIKRVIDDCDYYLLIIGGRYGSITPQGISYTEQEYDYAISKEIRVIALLHQNPDDIPLGKSERDPELRARLNEFRDKVSQGRLVRYWMKAAELPGIVSLSLSKTIKTHPARGWIRADRAASEDLLAEINQVRKQNSTLSSELAKLQASPPPQSLDLAGLDETFYIFGTSTISSRSQRWATVITWRQIFGFIAPYLIQNPTDDMVKGVLMRAAYDIAGKPGYSPFLDDQIFRTISVQLRALGLVRITYTKNVSGGMGLFWSATPSGERLTLELRTVKSSAGKADGLTLGAGPDGLGEAGLGAEGGH